MECALREGENGTLQSYDGGSSASSLTFAEHCGVVPDGFEVLA